MDWINLEDELPEPETLVWIKRKIGTIYLGCRKDRPIAVNRDFSKNCHWYGNHVSVIHSNTSCSGGLRFISNFQDGTVDSWMPFNGPTN